MESKDLATAKSAYQAAAQADPAHKRAAQALAEVKKDIVESQFRGHMTAGYAALDKNEFDQARSQFLRAGEIYKGNHSVEQALALVANREGQVGISRQIDRAAEFEAREEWQKAVQIYESLLQQDPSLVEVKVKLIPARVRSELAERLSAIIADPLKLSASAAYRNAQQALSDARGIPNPGEQLRGQIEAVEQLLQTAVSSVKVVFQSDNQTDVTVYRVARLGQFEETTLQLKPGKYIAAGTRQGFRDVRVEFTITGAPLDSPIVIRCEEPI
jgi:tetratricopeptide (TPR) repeat protein